jgi:hypothetical protein
METIVLNRGCKFPDCDKKHHGKGYCKSHYTKMIMHPNPNKCKIEDCENEIGIGAKGMCPMHYTRDKRNGSPAKVTRNRAYKSLLAHLKENYPGDTFLDFAITDRAHWARVCKSYYGDYCHECGWNETSCDVDHIISRKEGGLNTIRNGQVICPNCHAIKHRPPRKK